MARRGDIGWAFEKSVKRLLDGRFMLKTQWLVDELVKYNHYFTLKDANEWIEYYQKFFKDKTADFSDNREYFMSNMGYIL